MSWTYTFRMRLFRRAGKKTRTRIEKNAFPVVQNFVHHDVWWVLLRRNPICQPSGVYSRSLQEVEVRT